jgi:hypothetical protein
MSETLRIRDGTAVDAAQLRALADVGVVGYEPGDDPEDRTVSGGSAFDRARPLVGQASH